jgi:hypothetical protein
VTNSGFLKFAACDQFQAQVQPPCIIQREQSHGRAARWRDSFDVWSLEAKMVVPVVTSGMKQLDYLFGVGINARDVGSLVKITAMARKCEVANFVRAAMLFGDNVFDVVCQFGVLLWQPAILTTIICPLSDKVARSGIHN